MIRRKSGSTATCVLAGCVLGLATVGVALFTKTAPSLAAADSCVTHHTNVEGYDKGLADAFGNKGYIYINTSSVIGSLHDDIARSLAVIFPNGDDVEVGWFADPQAGYHNPTVYAEWINHGVDSGTQPDTSFSLSENSDVRFRVENVGDNDIWRFVVDGQSSPFNYSPTMEYNYGQPLTNSEHYNSCDSLYTDMYDLSDASSPGYWQSSYTNLECYIDTSVNDWYFHKISNSELDVTQTSSTCPGP